MKKLNIDEFIFSLEDEFEGSLSPARRHTYRNKMMRFSPEQLASILSVALEKYVTLPKIATLLRIAFDDLKIDTKPKRPKATGCSECRFSTWIYVTLHHPLSGEPYQAVTTCSCTPRKIKVEGISSVQFQGDVPQDEEDRIPF